MCILSGNDTQTANRTKPTLFHIKLIYLALFQLLTQNDVETETVGQDAKHSTNPFTTIKVITLRHDSSKESYTFSE